MLRLKTQRLNIRPLELKDVNFILELLNTDDFKNFIGDKGIRTTEDAKNYLINGPQKMYKQLGIGLCMVETLESHTSLGICGLIKRESLDDVDLGFGFLPKYYNKGYAFEASKKILDESRIKYKRVVAISNSNNQSSIKLLIKLGMKFEKSLEKLSNTVELNLYGINFNDN